MTLKSLVLALALIALSSTVLARDGWQGRPQVCDAEELGQNTLTCQEWVGNVKQPDQKNVSCCGEGDAYRADSFEVDSDGNTVAIISEDYPETLVDDGEGGTVQLPAIAKGKRIVIPHNKINHAYKDGNPSGHGIVFMNTSSGEVLCYFGPTLS